MPKFDVIVCPYCETQRFDSELNGRCRFCNTPLVTKEIELPDLSNSEKQVAKEFMSDRRAHASGNPFYE